MNTYIIFKREFYSFFNSPIAYIVISVLLVIIGFLFFGNFFIFNQASMRNFFNLAPFLFVFFCPAITMRLISEEKKSGTLEMLVTMPLSDLEIIAGKYLSTIALLLVFLFLSFSYPISIAQIGDLELGPVVGGYLGLLLLGGCYLSIGIFTSSATKNQIIAYVFGLLICLAFFLLDRVIEIFPGKLGTFLEFLSSNYHFRNITRGVIDSTDIIYYLSIIFVFITLSVQALQSRKWK